MQEVNKPYTVYMHIAPNNKVYVGITSQTLNSRARLDGSGYCLNSYFWRAIQKYGWDNFQHIIIEENLSQEKACRLEIELIKKYNSTNRDYGYNISLGGELGNYGRSCSEEAKRKISMKNKGRIKSAEERKQISERMKGKKHSPEHNRKVSEALKGKYVGELSSAYGLKRSEETRRRMSESAKKGWEKRRAKLNDDKRSDI